MKKTLSLILTLALAVSAFTACAGDNTETNAPATDASTETSKETTADTIGETEAVTEAETEAATEAATEAVTDAATDAETEAPGAETYDEILSAANIVHTPHFMVVGEVEFTSFVKIDDELGIICEDYAHEGDIIKGWKETLYMPIEEGATEEDITAMNQFLTALSEEFASLSCCKVENSTLKNMLVLSITFTNVDTDEAIAELYAAGLIEEEAKISMSNIEAAEISEGYIKK